VPYKEFVNNGTGGTGSSYSGVIVAADQTIDSLDLQITGGINYTSAGDFSATAGSIEITGPPSYSYLYSIYSAQDIQLYANTLLVGSAALEAGGALNFNVVSNLSDNGTASSFTCYNGFNLWIKPHTGDLPGSTFTSIASQDSEEIDHAWAGNDLGPVSAGFTNNVAIGTLVLSAQNPDANNYRLEPLFHFYGTGGSGGNAMYVNTLDLSQLTTSSAEVANMIQIDPGMKIYFNNIKLGFTPPDNQTPVQFVQGQFPGGQVTAVTAVASPFSLQTAAKNSAGRMAFSLAGTAGQTYVLQSSTDLFHWVGFSTNTLSSNSFPYLIPTTNAAKMFFRGLFQSP
jgi:hypothetical protein